MITIKWQLGAESGIETCPTDRHATKFTESLYAKKLALIDLTPGRVASFQNKVYKFGKMHGRKRKLYENEINELSAKMAILQQTKLSISVTR